MNAAMDRRLPLPTLLGDIPMFVLRKLLTSEASEGRPIPIKLFRRDLPSEDHRDAVATLLGGRFIETSGEGYRLRLRGVLVLSQEPAAARWLRICDMVLAILATQFHETDDTQATSQSVFERRTIADVTLAEVARALDLLTEASVFSGFTGDEVTGYVARCTIVENVAYAESIEKLVARGKLFNDAFDLHRRSREAHSQDPLVRTIRSAADRCANAARRLDGYRDLSDRIERAARAIDAAWSHSWIGYHARVYLEGLHLPGPDDHFDPDFGLTHAFAGQTHGPWREHRDDEVIDAVLARAGAHESDLDRLRAVAREVEAETQAARAGTLPILHAIEETEASPRVSALRDKIEKLDLRITVNALLSGARPTQIITRDQRALAVRRIEPPPHLVVMFSVFEEMSVRLQGEKLRALLTEVADLLDARAALRAVPVSQQEVAMSVDPRSVFVVHGRNLGARDAMHAYLRALGLAPLEWDQLVERTGKGSPYTGEVIEEAFKVAQAVVVLFTGDDLAKLDDRLLGADEKPERLAAQPRPNVLIEAGMAVQRDRGRTIIVRAGVTRHPSDFDGLNVVPYGQGDHEFRNRLRNRLRTARCAIDDTGSDWLRAGDFVAAFADHVTRLDNDASGSASQGASPQVVARQVDALIEVVQVGEPLLRSEFNHNPRSPEERAKAHEALMAYYARVRAIAFLFDEATAATLSDFATKLHSEATAWHHKNDPDAPARAMSLYKDMLNLVRTQLGVQSAR